MIFFFGGGGFRFDESFGFRVCWGFGCSGNLWVETEDSTTPV